jgi:hypothetical protein
VCRAPGSSRAYPRPRRGAGSGGFETQLARPHEPSEDQRAILFGIEAAKAEEREVDDATARRIASQLHGGKTSALYGLASAGAIDEERVYRELGTEHEQQRDPEVKEWINWLFCVLGYTSAFQDLECAANGL